MKASRGNIARRIISAYLSLALMVVLVSVISIVIIAYARQKLLLEVHQRNQVALLSARIRSEALFLTNSIQRYMFDDVVNNEVERQAINGQIGILEELLQDAVDLVNLENVQESFAIGSIRQYLVAFNVQSRKVLNVADEEGGFSLEAMTQMGILQNNYQPALIKALEDFENLERDSAEQALSQAEAHARSISIILSIVSVSALAFAVSMSFWLSRRFITPLTTLTDNVRMHPDISMETPIEIDTDDEMGALAQALNRMKTEIKETRYKLEQYAETLEAKVEERTLELKMLAITDPLTGVYNRGHFYALAGQILLEAKRMNFPFSVAMIDIDHFKNINDQFGHAAGDFALKLATATMQAQIRQMDVLGRYGGEEFVIALPAASPEEALQIGQRIVTAVSEIQMTHQSRAFGITISCGIASYNYENENLENILLRADKALYEAKQSGRNRVVAENDLTYKETS
jgi:diguanylate cyclase (GGDEF)-like protein